MQMKTTFLHTQDKNKSILVWLTTPRTHEDGEALKLVVEMQDHTVILEESWVVWLKVSILSPYYVDILVFHRGESIYPYGKLCINTHNSFVCNGQN